MRPQVCRPKRQQETGLAGPIFHRQQDEAYRGPAHRLGRRHGCAREAGAGAAQPIDQIRCERVVCHGIRVAVSWENGIPVTHCSTDPSHFAYGMVRRKRMIMRAAVTSPIYTARKSIRVNHPRSRPCRCRATGASSHTCKADPAAAAGSAGRVAIVERAGPEMLRMLRGHMMGDNRVRLRARQTPFARKTRVPIQW